MKQIWERKAYKILVGKLDRNRQLGKSRRGIILKRSSGNRVEMV
jgi:hypothetical protein